MVHCNLKVFTCIRYQNANLDPVLNILNLDPIHPLYMDLQHSVPAKALGYQFVLYRTSCFDIEISKVTKATKFSYYSRSTKQVVLWHLHD